MPEPYAAVDPVEPLGPLEPVRICSTFSASGRWWSRDVPLAATTGSNPMATFTCFGAG
jgi:hypothetical protein